MIISAPCAKPVLMPPAALVRIIRLTPSRPITRVAEHDCRQIVSLVEVRAPAERRDALAADVADDQSAGVADDVRRRPVRQVVVRRRDRIEQCVGEITEP